MYKISNITRIKFKIKKVHLNEPNEINYLDTDSIYDPCILSYWTSYKGTNPTKNRSH